MGQYHAFYFSSYHAKGGMSDYIDSFDDLDEAKKAIVKAIESSSLGYWGHANGEIVTLTDGKLEVVSHLYAYLKGNVDACRIDPHCFAWGDNYEMAQQLAKGLAIQHNMAYLK